MTNYQLETDRIIASLNHAPTLLLHACCAPCSSYVLEYLAEHFNITVFFYNPNITEKEEYEKRKNELKRLIAEKPFRYPVKNVNAFLFICYFIRKPLSLHPKMKCGKI